MIKVFDYIFEHELVMYSILGLFTLVVALININLLFSIIGLQIFSILFIKYYKYKYEVLIFLLLYSLSDFFPQLRNIQNFVIIIFLIITVLIEKKLVIKNYDILDNRNYSLIGLILLSTFLSTIFSGYFFFTFPFFVKQLLFFILIYAFYNGLKSTQKCYQYIYTLIFIGIIISLTILIDFFTSEFGVIILQITGIIQMGGVFKNVSAPGGILVITIPLTLVILFQKNNFKYSTKFGMLLLIVQVMAIIFTNSRAAILGVFISCSIILILLRLRIFIKLISVSVLLAVIIIVVYPQVLDLFSTFFRVESVARNPRSNLWSVAFSIIENNFWFGSGPGAFGKLMYKYNPVMLGTWSEIDFRFIHDLAAMGHAHNFVLFRFSELGIIGLIISILFPVQYFRNTIKLVKHFKKNDYNLYILSIGLVAVMVGLIARSNFESTGFISYGWITRDLGIWLLFSISLFLKRKYIGKE